MERKYYKIHIVETGRYSLREKAENYNEESKICVTPEEVKEYLKNHYGRLPNGKNKVYMDVDVAEGLGEEIGFTHSFWNRDISHNSKPWYQTDWIEISLVTEESILLKQL